MSHTCPTFPAYLASHWERRLPRTIKAYCGQIERWQDSQLAPVDWLCWLDDNRGPSTYQQARAALQAWGRFTGQSLGELPKTPKQASLSNFVLEQADVALFLAAFDHMPYRERAIVHLLYNAGLRNFEARTALLADLQLDQRTLVVVGKGEESRLAPFDTDTEDLLRAWLRWERHNYPNADKLPFLFLAADTGGGQVGENWLVDLIRDGYSRASLEAGSREQATRLAQASAIDRPVHLLRRCLASHMDENGAPITVTQDVLGHGSIVTTRRYIKHTPEHLRAQYDQYHGTQTQPQAARKRA